MQIIVTVLLLLPLGVIQAGSASRTGMLFLLERAKSGPGGLPVRPGCADPVLRGTEPKYVFRCGRRHESQRGRAGQNRLREYPACAGVPEVDAVPEQH